MSGGPIHAQLTPSGMLPRMGITQHETLEENFKRNRNPTDLEITLIAAEAGLTEKETRIWYRHRLAVWRQTQGLPANSGSVTD